MMIFYAQNSNIRNTSHQNNHTSKVHLQCFNKCDVCGKLFNFLLTNFLQWWIGFFVKIVNFVVNCLISDMIIYKLFQNKSQNILILWICKYF